MLDEGSRGDAVERGLVNYEDRQEEEQVYKAPAAPSVVGGVSKHTAVTSDCRSFNYHHHPNIKYSLFYLGSYSSIPPCGIPEFKPREA
jgi:hypothetical protein